MIPWVLNHIVAYRDRVQGFRAWPDLRIWLKETWVTGGRHRPRDRFRPDHPRGSSRPGGWSGGRTELAGPSVATP